MSYDARGQCDGPPIRDGDLPRGGKLDRYHYGGYEGRSHDDDGDLELLHDVVHDGMRDHNER